MKQTSGEKHISQRLEQKYMRMFQKYVRERGNQLMVVFDAGPALYQSEELVGGVDIVYSGQMHSADDVIIEYLRDHPGQDILLVTSDREIRDVAKACDIVSLASPEFHKIFTDVLHQYEEYEEMVVRDVVKTAESENSDLDRLMELGSRNIAAHQKNEVSFAPRYVRNNKKKSRADKQAMKKINKI